MNSKSKFVLYFYQAGHYPNPATSGADRIFFSNVNGLKHAGYEIIFIEIGLSAKDSSGKQHEFITINGDADNNKLSWFSYQYYRWVRPVSNPGLNKYSAFININLSRTVHVLFEKYNPDLLFFENIRTFLLIAKFKTDLKSIVCIHDLDYIMNYGKNLQQLKNSNSSKIIKYLRSIQIILQRISEKRFTVKYLNKANIVNVISQNDFRSLQNIKSKLIYIKCPVTLAPSKNQLKKIHDRLDRGKSKKVSILHIGKLNASHNRKAITWFLEYCWPQMIGSKNVVEFELRIIGSTKGFEEILVKYNSDTRIVFEGFVENIEDKLINADFMIVPPGYLTGVRTKIPESLAWGLPVITGSGDAFGAGVADGEMGVLTADSVEDYVSACVRLIKNPDVRKSLSLDALDNWEKLFSLSTIEESISEYIQEV